MLTTVVSPTTNVVNYNHNSPVDTAPSLVNDDSVGAADYGYPDWSTFARRLKWLAAELFAGNQSELADAVGLDRTHVNNTIRRDGEMGATTAGDIAEALGISHRWLTIGKGDPFEPPAAEESYVDPYPARARAVTEARRKGKVTETVIARARERTGDEWAKKEKSFWDALLYELMVDEMTAAQKPANVPAAPASEPKPTKRRRAKSA